MAMRVRVTMAPRQSGSFQRFFQFPCPLHDALQSLAGGANGAQQLIKPFHRLPRKAQAWIDIARRLPAPQELVDPALCVPAQDQPKQSVINRQESDALEEVSYPENLHCEERE